MEKYREVQYKNVSIKYYKNSNIIKPIEFLEDLQSKGIPVEKVFMKRDAEMDMQFGIGEYTIEELKQSSFVQDGLGDCLFTLKTEFFGIPVEIHFSENSDIVYMATPDPSIELDSLYEKKNNGLGL